MFNPKKSFTSHSTRASNYNASTVLNSFYSTLLGPNGNGKMLISPSDLTLSKNMKQAEFQHPYALILKQYDSMTVVLANFLFQFGFDHNYSLEISKELLKYLEELKICFKYGSRTNSNINNENQSDNNSDENTNKKEVDIYEQRKIIYNYIYTVLLAKTDPFLAHHLTKEFFKCFVHLYENLNIQDNSNLSASVNENNISPENLENTEKIPNKNESKQEQNNFPNLDLLEFIKMPGSSFQTTYIPGLVLDHANRHPQMPTSLKNPKILCMSISLEYEKPEINSTFIYKNSYDLDLMIKSEKELINNRCKQIVDFCKKTDAKFILNEKGIDLECLEILSQAGILALRRSKRRNLERVTGMCGGKIIYDVNELYFTNIKSENDGKNNNNLNDDILGFCGSINVKSIEDTKFTFITDVPFNKAGCFLVRGGYEINATFQILKDTIKEIGLGIKNGNFLLSGDLFSKIVHFLKAKRIETSDLTKNQVNDIKNEEIEEEIFRKNMGKEILKKSFEEIIKILLKNGGKNVDKEIMKLEQGQNLNFDNELTFDELIDEYGIDIYYGLPQNDKNQIKTNNKKFMMVETFETVKNYINNAIILSSNLLSVDDFIKAGKSVKEEKEEK